MEFLNIELGKMKNSVSFIALPFTFVVCFICACALVLGVKSLLSDSVKNSEADREIVSPLPSWDHGHEA